MPKVITKILKRDKFNKEVLKAEEGVQKLGIKKIDTCVYYSYIDNNGNTIKLICDE